MMKRTPRGFLLRFLVVFGLMYGVGCELRAFQSRKAADKEEGKGFSKGSLEHFKGMRKEMGTTVRAGSDTTVKAQGQGDRDTKTLWGKVKSAMSLGFLKKKPGQQLIRDSQLSRSELDTDGASSQASPAPDKAAISGESLAGKAQREADEAKRKAEESIREMQEQERKKIVDSILPLWNAREQAVKELEELEASLKRREMRKEGFDSALSILQNWDSRLKRSREEAKFDAVRYEIPEGVSEESVSNFLMEEAAKRDNLVIERGRKEIEDAIKALPQQTDEQKAMVKNLLESLDTFLKDDEKMRGEVSDEEAATINSRKKKFIDDINILRMRLKYSVEEAKERVSLGKDKVMGFERDIVKNGGSELLNNLKKDSVEDLTQDDVPAREFSFERQRDLFDRAKKLSDEEQMQILKELGKGEVKTFKVLEEQDTLQGWGISAYKDRGKLLDNLAMRLDKLDRDFKPSPAQLNNSKALQEDQTEKASNVEKIEDTVDKVLVKGLGEMSSLTLDKIDSLLKELDAVDASSTVNQKIELARQTLNAAREIVVSQESAVPRIVVPEGPQPKKSAMKGSGNEQPKKKQVQFAKEAEKRTVIVGTDQETREARSERVSVNFGTKERRKKKTKKSIRFADS